MSIVAAASPLLTLRRSTSQAHQRLEAALDLLSPALERERYADVLARFATVYGPLEQALAALADDELLAAVDVRGRAKVPLLAADLAALGRAWPVPSGRVPPIDSPAAAVGALYVTEGATLGGAIVASHVRDVLGPSAPTRFFGAGGAAGSRSWAEFRAAARDVLVDPDDIAIAAVTAQDLFAAFATAVGA